MPMAKDPVNKGPIKKVAHSVSSKKSGIMIPLYVYPNDIYSNADYNGVISLLRQYSDVPAIIILNPSSGPGTVVDDNYTAAIKRLRGAGATVVGYVSTDYTNISESAAIVDIDKWMSLYPEIEGIFLDEMTNDDDQAHRNYYRNIKTYCNQKKGLYPVIGNPGSLANHQYYTQDCVDIVVVHENSTQPTEANLKGDFQDGHSDFNKFTRATLVYTQASFSPSLVNTMVEYVGWIYVTDDGGDGNPWDSVSAYLEDTLKQLSQANLEARIDVIEDTLLGEDGDTTINKLHEVIALLSSFQEGQDLLALITGTLLPTQSTEYGSVGSRSALSPEDHTHPALPMIIWRMVTNEATGTQEPVGGGGADWEISDDNQTESPLGSTAVTESSGTFTFGSDGYWSIRAYGSVFNERGVPDTSEMFIQQTIDNSTYSLVGISRTTIESNSVGTHFVEVLLKINQRSLQKIQLKQSNVESYLIADPGLNLTYIVFERKSGL